MAVTVADLLARHDGLLDQTEGRLNHVCSSCGKLFVSSAYQAEFCSDRCRYRTHKQAQRERQKRALESFRNGMAPAAIAAQLGTTPEVVRGWVKKAKPDTTGAKS